MAHFSTRHVRHQAERLLSQHLRPGIYRDREPVRLTAWETPGEPVPFEEAVAQEFSRKDPDEPWGRPWGTTWFRILGTLPGRWADVEGATPELIADIGFREVQSGFQCEALAYDGAGRVLKGVEPFNRYVPLPAGETVDIYLEAASNPDVIHGWSFEPTFDGSPSTMGTDPLYTITEIALGLRDHAVHALVLDLEVLLGLASELGDDTTRGTGILSAVSRALNEVDLADVSATATAARDQLRDVLAAPAYAGAHRVAAVGHAHIDSAWLWPIRETSRKVARTFSNVLDLLERDPDFMFAASSAQQYAWLKESHPDLFDRLREAVDDGRFVPVGGMWVESDSNMPGGEAMVRQFVEGAKFFRSEFGVGPKEVWLPDSFGYSAAMPQIARLAGARWFLTQKLSWNETNRMPHHTFWWEGIDGSRVFTHFPPSDTYGSDLSAEDLHRAERQFREKAETDRSLLLFGYGDGGGGPTREMLGTAHRTRDLAGSPQVSLTGPHEFFAAAEREYAGAPVWSGEMYLEFHRGVFTSQALGKRGNRRSEALLHEAELWAAAAAVRAGLEYPYDDLERFWRKVLLYQFHDILPGTCIAWVHDEVAAEYARLHDELERIVDRSIRALAGEGAIALRADPAPPGSLSAGLAIVAVEPPEGTRVRALEEGAFELRSAHMVAVVDAAGRIVSASDARTGREAIAEGGGNTLELFLDHPTAWDAWNIDRDYEEGGRVLDAHEVRADGDAIVVVTKTGASTIAQRIGLEPGRAALRIDTSVDWRDNQKLLKLGFNLDLRASYSASEIQFGHVLRPVHRNTSWDAARYEIPAHRWIHVAETGYGVALANHTTYGHDVSRHTREDGGTTTKVRASLLRAARYPDPESDLGEHSFSHVLRLDAGISEAIDEGYRLHWPPRPVTGACTVAPLVTVGDSQVRAETVKLAEDRSGDLILRLYESLGGRVSTTLSVDPEFTTAVVTDLHEEGTSPLEVTSSGDASTVHVALRPFQILTLRFSRS